MEKEREGCGMEQMRKKGGESKISFCVLAAQLHW